MKISHPFIIKILNKQEVHPLQAASNQSGEKLIDMAGSHEFSPPKRSSVVVDNDLLLPPAGSPLFANLPEYLQLKKNSRREVIRNTRNTLWLSVAWREKRINAQFCRLFELALPPEIELSTAKEALTEFAQSHLVSQGMIADMAIHESQSTDPLAGNKTTVERTGFLMCTTRPFETGEFINKTRSWNDRAQLIEWRRLWFDTLAKHLPPDDHPKLSQHSKDLRKYCQRFGTRPSLAPLSHGASLQDSLDAQVTSEEAAHLPEQKSKPRRL